MKPKQNHCYGHTPQIQKGAETSNSGVERMPFVTVCVLNSHYLSVPMYIYICVCVCVCVCVMRGRGKWAGMGGSEGAVNLK